MPSSPSAASTEASSPIRQHFCALLEADHHKSPAVAAIETLYHVLTISTSSTVVGLTNDLNDCVAAMISTDYSCTSVRSASQLFMRFISLTVLDMGNYEDCRQRLFERGQMFKSRVALARGKIAKSFVPFIKDGMRILTHSYSRCVTDCLLAAAEKGVKFSVFVTESRPDCPGVALRNKLAQHGIVDCTVILDAACAYVMEDVDCVLIGAEGIAETGGVLNKIGTLMMCVAAKAMNKPVYVVAETIKFIKEYPLNQYDIPNDFKFNTSTLSSGKCLLPEHPLIDYTPPQYIKLIFTDMGILTPAAVSDELIKLYL